MPLNEDDIREILRLIDESDVEELRVESGELSLHVVRGAAAERETEPEPEVERTPAGELHTIAAPMIGTFYRAEAPGAAPFVAVGARVEPMNAVPAGVIGTIVEVCAENAAFVEYGTPLFQVEPDR
jgi:biotin carboxyl carrier protein